MRRRVALLLVVCSACGGPRIAGSVERGTYRAPSGEWSIDLPLEGGLCVVSDEVLPEQENVLFGSRLPFGELAWQIAVTHRAAPESDPTAVEEDVWFGELVARIEGADGGEARLLASGRLPYDPSTEELEGLDCWARAYWLDAPGTAPDRVYAFLLQPLPARSEGSATAAVLFSVVTRLPADRPRLGDGERLPSTVQDAWRGLLAWRGSFEYGP